MVQLRIVAGFVLDGPRQAVGLDAHSIRVAFPVGHFVGKDQSRCSRPSFIVRRSPPSPQLQPQLRRPRHLHRLAEGHRHLNLIIDRVGPVRPRIRGDRHSAHRRGRRGRAHRRRRRAGERLGMAEVVVEAHPHLEGLAQVGVDQGVGARILARNVGLRAVHPNPLVRVGGAGQPVRIHDAGGDRRQRLAHLGRARDGRRARRRGVGGAGGGGGVVAVGGVGGAHGVDGGDAVVAGGGGVEPHVGVGGVGALGVGDPVGPAGAVGGDLDLVAGDGGAAGAGRGGPGEVDLGRPVGGRGQPGGRAGRGEGDEPDADVGAGGPGDAGIKPDPASAA